MQTHQPSVINRVAVGDMLRRAATRFPDKPAIVDGPKRLTYGELDARSNQFARFLLAQDLPPGSAVATLCLNSAEMVVAIFGIARAGMVWVPINPLVAGADLQYVLSKAEVKLIVADDELLARTRADIEKLCQRIVVIPVAGTALGDGGRLTTFAAALEGQESSEPPVAIAERDVAQIMFTSGTTAQPKGVMISHLAVYLASLGNIIELGLREDDVATAMMPLFHCAQHTMLASFLHLGATSVLVRRFDPGTFLETVQRERITWMFAIPMIYRALLAHPARSGTDLSSLRYCLYAMAPMDQPTLRRLMTEFCPQFALASGQTEMYPGTVFFRPEEQLRRTGSYWGRPSLINDMAIMDLQGNLLAKGKIGELVQRGPNVMEGYLHDPDATAAARRHGWHHTGDLGYFDDDGLFVFVDRIKDMIKTGGENVASIKVEAALLGHPAVANTLVVGLPHPHWSEAVTAFVVLKPGSSVSEVDLLAHCAAQLGQHEVPKAIVMLDTLPMTATGKAQKHVLRSRYQGFYEQRD